VQYLTPEQVAERYQISEATVKEWRYKRVGPAYLRLGKRVRYSLASLEKWEREREVARGA
jgi:predicted DNA-binding transcriptional regulator AlpA